MTKKLLSAGLGLGLLAASAAVFAQDGAAAAAAPAVVAAVEAAAVVEAVPTLSAGDTAWMLTSTMLVILMI
ncbi:MAG: ammonia channel protein, partial [Comamonas sp.]